jgi:hypothetical protein
MPAGANGNKQTQRRRKQGVAFRAAAFLRLKRRTAAPRIQKRKNRKKLELP